jgi:dTDP-4-dehydrorhamnose 3,5-epimerase
MEISELEIKGAWLAKFPVYDDNRGIFREWFKRNEVLEKTGIDFEVQQVNFSSSVIGVVRGLHYSLALNGQAKWITCTKGSIFDVIVDLRPTSPTFKKWISVNLTSESGETILISEGLGHAFLCQSDEADVAYLLSSPYSPENEYAINPLDQEIGIKWPEENLILSPKDSEAPSLATRYREDLLPK